MNRRLIARQLGIIFGGLLVLYIASIGPMWALAVRKESFSEKDGQSEMLLLFSFYAPLRGIAEACPPFGKCLIAYHGLWSKIIPPASLEEKVRQWDRNGDYGK
jgi:hypothetical protein